MLGFQLFYLAVEQGVFEFPARNLSIWSRNLTLTRFCLTEPEFDVSRSFLFGSFHGKDVREIREIWAKSACFCHWISIFESPVLLGLVELDFDIFWSFVPWKSHCPWKLGRNTFLNLSQGDLTVNVSWAFSPINSPAPRPKITAAIVMLRRERSICVWET